jgi:CHAD domain-containing protein
VTTLSTNGQIPADAVTPPVKRYVLGSDEPAAIGLHRILIGQLDLASFHARHLSEPDRHVHELRKATKRFRAVLRMVRDELEIAVYRDLNAAVRDVSRSLSHARSSVVMVDVFDDLVAENPDLASVVLPMGIALEADRDRALLAVDQRLVDDLAQELTRVRARLEEDGTLGEGPISPGGIRRTYRRGRKGMEHAYATGLAESFHMWRKQVKYLRHQMEVLAQVGAIDIVDIASGLESLGESLGRDNDLVDLARWVSAYESRRGPSAGGEALLSVIKGVRADLESVLRGPAASVYYRPPSDFVGETIPSWDRRVGWGA